MDYPHIGNKVVVVTGAGGRLGRRMVEGFARSGGRVAAVVRNPAERSRITEADSGTLLVADVADEAEARGCFDEVQQRLGRVDVLVHTVGTWSAAPLEETSLDEWELLMRTNLTSAFLCFREAVRAMQGGPGCLIGFAAGQGADRGKSQQAAYAASKAGLIRLVEAVSEEYVAQGVTAHAVAPSSILYGGESEAQEGVQADALVELCLYLCSDIGKALNGATLRAYGSAH
ncbi:MAG TPA: SDR family oxidoreductase [Rhodothermales bacterium]|nr:SDR family oxidoreductase [Rhodothermales bacterium]